jgi:hypothetical protein
LQHPRPKGNDLLRGRSFRPHKVIRFRCSRRNIEQPHQVPRGEVAFGDAAARERDAAAVDGCLARLAWRAPEQLLESWLFGAVQTVILAGTLLVAAQILATV